MAAAEVAPAPVTREIALSCKSDFADYEHGSKETSWAVVSIQAPQCQEDESGEVSESGRAPLELVAVIDKSGSMSSNSKLTMVKETMLFVIQQLSAHDKLGIVVYDSNVTSTGSLKTMDAHGKAELTALVEQLRTGSCTNLSGGLLEGLAMIEDLQKSRPAAEGEDAATAKAAKKTVSSLLLMTDGIANEGLTSIHDIVKCLTPLGRDDYYPDGQYRAGSGSRQRQRHRQARPMQVQSQAPVPAPPPQRGLLGNLMHTLTSPFSSSSSRSSPPTAQSNVLLQQAPPPVQQQQAPPPVLQQQAPAPASGATPPPPPGTIPPPPGPPPAAGPPPAYYQAGADSPPSASNGKKELSDEVAASVYTFGFGADHNAELLQAISNAGNGVYYYIDNSEKIPECFADCLGGLLSTAAQNITVEVTTENECVVTHAYAGRSTKSKDSGTHLTLPVGDIQSEECRDLVFCMELPAVPEPVADCVVFTAKLTCFNVLTSMMEVKEVSLKVNRVAKVEEGRKPNPDVDQHRNRITTAQVMENASALADQGDLVQARHVIVEQQMCLRASASNDTAVTAELDRDMSRMTEGLGSEARWHKGGKHLSSNIAQKHMAQRSNDVLESGYGNRMKAKKKAEFKSRS